MESLLEELANNEAVLLMYLVDELPPEDRAEVEQQLANDRGLRDELERLRAADSAVRQGLAALDMGETNRLAGATATRQVVRLMRQWRLETDARRSVGAVSQRVLRYPWWIYPMATAAAVTLAFLAWWGNNADTNFGSDDSIPKYVKSDVPAGGVNAEVQPITLAESFEGVDRADSVKRLSSAEGEASAVAVLSKTTSSNDLFDSQQ